MATGAINPRAVLLDMGGVVLDVGTSRGVPHDRYDWRGREALVRFLVDRGGKKLRVEEIAAQLLAPWRERYRNRADMGREAPWEPHLERLRNRAGVDASAAPSEEILAAWFEPFGDSLNALPAMVATLARLAAGGRKLALVSNVPLPGILYRRVLERLMVADRFDSFQFSYDAGTRKPSPALVRSALAALGVPAAEASTGEVSAGALMVGDRQGVDVAAGRAAGVTTVWVQSDHSGGPRADYEIGRLSELPNLLRPVMAGVEPPTSE